ncbi:shufflon system plasmid conjugative transfer pilus tip adhesin PilV [Collimonas sp.]|uniref:shufflon system plasmid conjugative transfer pilus tip adhesin PilV n=1 Tax=Collimonas sp. TaxID=1963772 RepID=UPI002C92A6EF|nr:shufflon system plasmid conjugative transfer pilus tip adhesin PilV [Collimonas sp.]HWW05995.1 shufflon system plasmid conjugative transfer pilus tip adhesin PilV [Collimonas sp.]
MDRDAKMKVSGVTMPGVKVSSVKTSSVKKSNMKRACTKKPQSGIALLELMGALAVGSIIMVGLSAMMDTSLEDTKGGQAAYYQSQIVNAANKYISANWQTLQTRTPSAATVIAISVADLKAGQFLSNSIASANVYGQTPCVLLRQPDPAAHPGQFDALIATTGGQKISDRDLAAIAMNAGQGSGYISAADPATAKGASWSMDTSPYRSVACSGAAALAGTAADGGHLVSNLFYNSAGQLSTDFLYRNAVPGRPELNRMYTPLRMASAALVNLGSSCLNQAGVAEAGMAVDNSTRSLLTCGSNGVWTFPSQWKEPVASYGNLPFAGSNDGDVRMVTGLNRAFTYNGGSWVALAVDQNDNLSVPGTVSTANLIASQSIDSQGTIHASGTINSDSDIGAGRDMSAGRDISASRDITANRDVTAVSHVYGRAVEASGWMDSPSISLSRIMSPGDACHFWDIDANGRRFINTPMGTIAMDSQHTPLICYADKEMRYANATFSP